MGKSVSKVNQQPLTINVIMVGLDSCGKSTILKNFKPTNGMSIFATYFQVETIKYKNLYVNLWDMSGEAENRENWSQQYPSVDAIIFVVDSTDYKRIEEAAVELHKMLSVRQKEKLLVIANKQDLPNVMNEAEVTKKLRLKHIRNRPWCVKKASGETGEGLKDAFKWLHREATR